MTYTAQTADRSWSNFAVQTGEEPSTLLNLLFVDEEVSHISLKPDQFRYHIQQQGVGCRDT